MKKILILLSTYNGQMYLRELLDSLVHQKDVAADLLVRDDGSKDRTLSVLDEFRSLLSIHVIRGKNVGPSKSFFRLIRSAPLTYDYYAFCDQDDVWMEDKLSTAVKRLDGFDPASPCLYYSGQDLVDDDLELLSRHILDDGRSEKANFIFNQMAGCTAVFNRALMTELQSYSPHHIYMHDAWCYKLCCVLQGHICIDPEGKILYRQHSGNTIGYQNSLKGKLKQVAPHFQNRPGVYAREILKGYGDRISPDWREFLTRLGGRKTIADRIWLLTDREIDFHSLSLRTIYILKIAAGRY